MVLAQPGGKTKRFSAAPLSCPGQEDPLLDSDVPEEPAAKLPRCARAAQLVELRMILLHVRFDGSGHVYFASRTRSAVIATSDASASFSAFPESWTSWRTVRDPSQRGSRCASHGCSSTSVRLKSGSCEGSGRASMESSRCRRGAL